MLDGLLNNMEASAGGTRETGWGDDVRRGLVGHGKNSGVYSELSGKHQRNWKRDLSKLRAQHSSDHISPILKFLFTCSFL